MRDLRPALAAEFVGTALLLMLIVGSGIAVEKLSADPATALFIHAATVGLGLAALIAALGPISGAHFNPAVTLGFLMRRALGQRQAALYVVAQTTGGILGTVLTHVSFGQSIDLSSAVRSGLGLWTSELVATAVLVGIILLLVHLDRGSHVPAAVGAWVAAAIVATASTGFANPAVTVGRAVTDSYTGIAPASVPMFLVAQLAGAFVAVMFVRSVVRREGAHT